MKYSQHISIITLTIKKKKKTHDVKKQRRGSTPILIWTKRKVVD